MYSIIIGIFVLFIFQKNLIGEELVIPIIKLIPLSKTASTLIPGASNKIIKKEDIIKHKNLPIHDIIELETGIKSRSIYGSNSSGSKTTLDIRGMGAQAKSNVLILINGQRLNNIDMSEIDFPSIPKNSIDRIEIYKGNSSSVLYGDGAIGGSINIITDTLSSNKKVNKINLKSGTFNYKEVDWHYSDSIENYIFSSYLNNSSTDGYRDHNEQQQTNFSIKIKKINKKDNQFLKIRFSDQNLNTPSDRSQTEIYTDRKGTDTPNDYIKSDGGSVFYGLDNKLNNKINFILNGSLRVKDSYSDLQSSTSPSYNETFLKNYQISPRIKHERNFLKKKSDMSYGYDLQYADYYSHRKKNQTAVPLHVYDAWQLTQSLYFHQSLELTNKINFGTGFRIQNNQVAIGDHLEKGAPDYAGWQTQHKRFDDNENNYAFNIGVDYQIDKKTMIYARTGSGFRYANIDDRIGGSGDTSFELNTQKTKDYEIGSKFKSNKFSSNLSIYRIDGKNELAYDSDNFVNINMNSTRRLGFETNTQYEFSKKITLTNNITFAKANYTSGNQGKYAKDFNNNEVPLVPPFSLDSSVDFKISDNTRLLTSIKFQDKMRMESDDENFQPKIPSYFTADTSLNSNIEGFEINFLVKNIFDERYYNYAVASSNTYKTYNAYPLPRREIILSISKSF